MSCRSLMLIFLATLFLGGCATSRIPFPENELGGLKLDGDVTISGKVFLIDQFEEEQLGEKTGVILEPVSSYSEQWYEVKYLQNKSLAKADSRYEKFLKKTTSDEKGNYNLSGVSPGDYLLTGSVFWKAITCSGNVAKTEVLISKKISIKTGDKNVEIPLTKKFESPIVACDLYNQSEWTKNDYDW